MSEGEAKMETSTTSSGLKISSSVSVGETKTVSPPPEPVAAAPAVEETKPAPKVTTTKKTAPAKTKSESSSSKVTTTKTTKKTVVSGGHSTIHSDDIYRQLDRDYHASQSVLEGISSNPVLYNRTYEPVNPKLSLRSKRAIRDASELALVSPGLKSLLEVEYIIFILAFSAAAILLKCALLCHFGFNCCSM